MKRRLSDYLVAIIVIACSVVLLGAMTVALHGYRLHKNTRTLHIRFTDVAGVRLQTEVRYAGAPAGHVVGIRPLTVDERLALPADERNYAILVDAEIDPHVPPLPSDIEATLGSDTLLSEKFVALSPGTPGGELLADDAQIAAKSAGSIDELIASFPPLVKEATELIAQLKENLGTVVPQAGDLLEELQTTAKNAQSALQSIDGLVADNEDEVHSTLEEVQKTLTEFQTVAKRADGLLDGANGFVGQTNSQLEARMKELSIILQNLKVVSTHAKAITETLGEKPSRLIWGSKENKLPSEAEIIRSNKPIPGRAP